MPIREIFCEASLRSSLRLDEFGKALRLDKIHLPVLKSAPGKLPGFRLSQSLDSAEGFENGCNDCPTAVDLQFGAIFSRERRRSLEEKYQSAI
jgi:hypothetical protein